MIKFNETYTINNGQESIVFKEGKANTITGEYNDGTLTGTLEGNVLRATFHNKKTNGAGLIEFAFTENGFSAKWKQGLEPGPMKGKWEGRLHDDHYSNSSITSESETVLFQLEVNSIEEYGINYGEFFAELNVESNILNDFKNECNYKTLTSLITSVFNNNSFEILRVASQEIDLDELNSSDYDWWSYSPCIRILKIEDVDLLPLYKVYDGACDYNNDASELLKVEEDDISDYVSDFMNDVAFHFEKETFLSAIE